MTTASYAKWNLKLDGARILRPDLDDALNAYAHYLEHSGTDLHIDYEEAYAEDANVRKAVDAEIFFARQEAERIYEKSGQTNFQMTGKASWVGRSSYPITENWQKTLGDHAIYGTSNVTVHGNQITMKVIVHAEDRYNFNRDVDDRRPDPIVRLRQDRPQPQRSWGGPCRWAIRRVRHMAVAFSSASAWCWPWPVAFNHRHLHHSPAPPEGAP